MLDHFSALVKIVHSDEVGKLTNKS